MPGSTGRQAADSLGEDEDAEGRSESAQMFEEGITEAEHVKCVRHPGLTRRATKKSHNSRACRGNSGCARKNSRTRLNRKRLLEQEQKVVWATHFAPAVDLFTQKVEGTAWKSKPNWYVGATSDRTVATRAATLRGEAYGRHYLRGRQQPRPDAVEPQACD